MRISSASFAEGEPIPRKFSGEGENINPELKIEEVPPETKSLALIMHDPDAPRPGGFTHWLMWNIDPAAHTIPENFQVPSEIKQGANGAGKKEYMGPYPPVGHGIHHYHFKLYALDEALSLPDDVSKENLEAEIAKHKITEAECVGIYERKG